jgi:small subunit ribosomal protein S5
MTPTVDSEFSEEVIFVNRVAKVVKGGRKFGFSAIVAVGDKKERVGLGIGKAAEVVEAIRKASDDAKKNMITVPKKGTTVPYELNEHFCASTVIVKPAPEGHGIIAGGPARVIFGLAGITDVTAKFVGSSNQVNCAKVTFQALKNIMSPEHIMEMRNR